MNGSTFLTSFLSKNCRGSNPFTSPAIRAACRDASKCVIGPIPLCPAQSAVQLASVPMPTEEIRPTPVMTTRRCNVPPVLLLLGVAFDVLDGFLHAGDLLGVFVRDLDPELFFERHDQLDGIQGVGPEIVYERRVRRY